MNRNKGRRRRWKRKKIIKKDRRLREKGRRGATFVASCFPMSLTALPQRFYFMDTIHACQSNTYARYTQDNSRCQVIP
jgi:hypothetical protein